MKFSSFKDVLKLSYFLHKICGYFPMTLDFSKAGTLQCKTTLIDNVLFCASVIFVGIGARLNSMGKAFLETTDSKITQSGFVIIRYVVYLEAFLRVIFLWFHREQTVKMLSNVLVVDQKVCVLKRFKDNNFLHLFQLTALGIKINYLKQFIVSLIILLVALIFGSVLIVAINTIEYLDGIESTKKGFTYFCYVCLTMTKIEYDNIQILLIWTFHSRIKMLNETLR